MGFILPLILLGIALVCIAILGSDGLWHNIITFFNVLVAGLLATNYYEPLTDWIDYQAPSFTYLLDFVVLWLLFALFFVLFRLLTDLASGVRVRFKKPVDLIGGYVVSVWTAWLLICFTTMSLHTTALSRNFFGDTFQVTPESKNAIGAPDRQWLALVHKLSSGYGSMRSGGEKQGVVVSVDSSKLKMTDAQGVEHVYDTPHVGVVVKGAPKVIADLKPGDAITVTEGQFDPHADFILRYAQRRADYETKEGVRVNREYGQPAGQPAK